MGFSVATVSIVAIVTDSTSFTGLGLELSLPFAKMCLFERACG
jgi:hypothetical protein